MINKSRVSKSLKNVCVICKSKTCVDKQHEDALKSLPDQKYSGRITRNMSRIHKIMNEFVLHEVYKCMPLLGDEKCNAPDWDIHIVHYAVIFGDVNK